MNKKRILTGDNTTGRLHVGHYVGSLQNRVKLQEEYDTIIILADMHALAYPKYIQNTQIVHDSIIDVAIGNLAVGLDPKKVTMFQESEIPEMYELGIIFSMITPYNRNLRNPTIKDEIRDKGLGNNYSLGFINFPVLMAVDILSVKTDLVPVGEDQLPHIELTRELARRFNKQFGEVFKGPKALVSDFPRLPGLDGGAKMTKSLGNTIFLNESKEDLKAKIMSMYTDPNRIRATDPGKVEGNPVFVYHEAFNTNKEEVKDLKERYTKGTVGDVEVKEKLFLALNTFLEPIREEYNYYQNHKDEVVEILKTGSQKTREIVNQTLKEVKEKMKLSHF